VPAPLIPSAAKASVFMQIWAASGGKRHQYLFHFIQLNFQSHRRYAAGSAVVVAASALSDVFCPLIGCRLGVGICDFGIYLPSFFAILFEDSRMANHVELAGHQQSIPFGTFVLIEV